MQQSPNSPHIAATVEDIRTAVDAWHRQGLVVGLVPTMGALHKGHLSLVSGIQKSVDKVIVSIFVNPKQFGKGEDFGAYPRDLEKDATLLAELGVDVIYAPTPAVMYPDGFKTTISVADLSTGFEGTHRPGHFDGVATVVSKLLIQTGADKAIFGEKDFQQLAVIRRLARDLDLRTEILVGPLVRDEYGLALSSRNAYLSADELAIARQFNGVLKDLVAKATGGSELRSLEQDATQKLLDAGFSCVDYVSIINPDTLEILEAVSGPARVVATARLGSVRLLDTMAI